VLPATITKADQVFPYFLTTKIPSGLAGLFMASLFSAAMSMLSSDLNCLSLVGVEDVYRRFRPKADDQRRLLVGKLIVGVCGALAILVAVVIAWKSERVLSFYFTVSSIVAGGLAGLFLLAFLSPRANRAGAWTGIVACKDRVLDLGSFNFPWAGVMIGVVGHVILLGAGWLGSLAFPSADNGDSTRQLTLWGWLDRRKEPAQPAA
jgi:SSS family solute:Na+ symporter